MRCLVFAAALASAPASAPLPPAETLTVTAVLLELDARNPAIAEVRELSAAGRERARAARTLPAPMLRAQTWSAPLERPWDAGSAEMSMLGVEQTLPSPSRWVASTRAERAAADRAGEGEAALRASVQRDARVAFHELWRARREVETHRDHVELSRQVLALAESRYASGSGRQHDVLRAQLAVSSQHAAVHQAEGALAAAAAALAALLSKPEAAIGRPEVPADIPPLPALESMASERAEVRAAGAAVRERRERAREAHARAWIPDVTLGATWMDMAMGEDRGMAMVELELPWGWGGRRANARASARERAAAEAALRSVRDGAAAELRAAHARAAAARQVLELERTDILPSAERTAEAVRSAWVAGNAALLDVLDAEEQRLLARLQTDRARAQYESSLADLDRAAGRDPLAALTADPEGDRR